MLKLKYPLNQEVLEARIQDAQKAIAKMEEFKSIEKDKFLEPKDNNSEVVENNLRKALEAILSSTTHILSRISGAKIETHKDNMKELERFGILPSSFVETAIKMAGYRNRLVHFYYEVSKEELYQILQNNLEDLKKFIKFVARFLLKHKEDKEFTMIQNWGKI